MNGNVPGPVGRIEYGERWPGIVQNNLGAQYRLMEDALNSRTLMWEDTYSPHRQGLGSLEEALDANAPLDLVIIMLGVNELKHVFNLSPGLIANGMDKLVKAAQVRYYNYPAPKILVIAPPPVWEKIGDALYGYVYGPDAYAKSLEVGKLYKGVAERNGCEFIDCADLDFGINEVDGLHYSREDHAKLAEAVTQKILEIFA